METKQNNIGETAVDQIPKEFPYRRVWTLAWPNITSNILTVSISFGHLWIVSSLGPEASAAVGMGGRIHFLLMAAVMALSIATTAIVARAWGAKNTLEASGAVTSSLGFALLLSISMSLPTYYFADSIAAFFSEDRLVQQLTADYIRPMSLFNVIFAMGMTLATGFRAIGDVQRPMHMIAYSTIANLMAAYVLANGTFGVPQMGVAGIAWGAGIAQTVIFSLYLISWAMGRYALKPVKGMYFDRHTYQLLTTIGTPAIIEQLIMQSGFIVFMKIIASYGTEALAAYIIGITILSICIVVGLGFGAAGATLTGQTLGAGETSQARTSGYKAMQLAIGITTILALLFIIFRSTLAGILTQDSATMQLTVTFLIILALCQPLMAIEFSIGGSLRGAGDTKYPLYTTIVGMMTTRIIIGISAWYLGASITFMYSIIIVDYLIKAFMLLRRFAQDDWIIAHNIKDAAPSAVQADIGVNRTAVREYFKQHPDIDFDDPEQVSHIMDTDEDD